MKLNNVNTCNYAMFIFFNTAKTIYYCAEIGYHLRHLKVDNIYAITQIKI